MTSTSSEGYQVNPLYNATLSSFSTTRNQALRNTLDAKWYVTKDFYISGQFNVDIKSSQSDKYTSPDDASFLGKTDPAKRGSYRLGTGKAFNYDGKIVFNYSRNLGQEGSGFVINAGSDIQHTNATTSYITAMGFLKDNLSDIKYALGYDPENLPGGTETLLAKVGFFASGNIYFRNRYFADVSYRTSGSSAYGKDNRFTPMWSFGLGWNLHKEKFLENVKWIDVLRLKWSWGYNGQTTGSPYQAITTYKYDNKNIYYTGAGTVPIRMGNPELKWQRVLKNNFGINLSATLNLYKLTPDGKLYDKLFLPGRIESTGWSFGYTFKSRQDRTERAINDITSIPPEYMNPFYDPYGNMDPVLRRQYMAQTYYDFSLPWNFGFNYTVNYSISRGNYPPKGYKKNITQTIGFNGSVNLTPKTGVTFQGGYDIKQNKLTTSSVSISRDLHCWQMSFSWIPFGYHRSWSFNIGVKAASLSDLKYDKSQSMYDNMY